MLSWRDLVVTTLLKLENLWTEVKGSCPPGHDLPALEAAGWMGSPILRGCRHVMLGFPRRSGTRFRGRHKPTCMVKSSRKGDGVSILILSHRLSACQIILTWKLGVSGTTLAPAGFPGGWWEETPGSIPKGRCESWPSGWLATSRL